MTGVFLKVRDREYDFWPNLERWVRLFSDGEHQIVIWNDSSREVKIDGVRTVTRRDLTNGAMLRGLCEVLSPSWRDAGLAHLASYWLTEGEFFWNIDADDMHFQQPVPREMVCRIEDYARANDVLAFSWDLSWSCHVKWPEYPHHWTFGFSFLKRDWAAVEKLMAKLHPLPPWGLNIDAVFEAGKADCDILSFAFENTLVHQPQLHQFYCRCEADAVSGWLDGDGPRRARVYKDVVVFEPDGAFRRSVDGYRFRVRSRRGFGRDLLAVDGSEKLVYDVLKGLASRDKVFVDVGAHVGEHSIRMASYYGRVVAIEPVPHNVECLRSNVAANWQGCSVEVLETACGDRSGTAEIVPMQSDSTMDPVVLQGLKRHMTVPVEKLENLVPKADVIKIDVEGWEEHVLRGARRLIGECRPCFLIEHHEFRGYKVQTVGPVKRLLPGYIRYDLDGLHSLYVPMGTDRAWLRPALVAAATTRMFNNVEKKKPWYDGMPGTWWWGLRPAEVIAELGYHVSDDHGWVEWLGERCEG